MERRHKATDKNLRCAGVEGAEHWSRQIDHKTKKRKSKPVLKVLLPFVFEKADGAPPPVNQARAAGPVSPGWEFSGKFPVFPH